jgi:hypothetical protein
MKNQTIKIKALNDRAPDFYYCIDNRNYVHSTTFLLLAKTALNPVEISVSIKSLVTKGFNFGSFPEETDLGHLEIDGNIFYIKSTDTDLKSITEDQVDFEQRLLLNYQRLITSSAEAMCKEKKKLLSRKLTVFCSLIFDGSSTSIEIKRTMINKKFTLYDILIDKTVAWRQLGWG